MLDSVDELALKLAEGDPLTPSELGALAATTDIVTLGMLAGHARQRLVGETATFVRVLEVPLTGPLPQSLPPSAREVRLVGAPESIDAAVTRVREVRALVGDLPVTGLAVDALLALASLDRLEGIGVRLKDAGLDAIADWPVDRVSDAAPVLALQRASLRVPVARWAETPGDLVVALQRVRALQAAANGLRAFAPLTPSRTDAPSTGYDDVKTVALSRMVLDNVEHVQVDWAAHGAKLAQVSLLFGASDVDRVSPSDESPLGYRRAPLEEIRRNIEAASLTAAERDGRFARVAGYAA